MKSSDLKLDSGANIFKERVKETRANSVQRKVLISYQLSFTMNRKESWFCVK